VEFEVDFEVDFEVETQFEGLGILLIGERM